MTSQDKVEGVPDDIFVGLSGECLIHKIVSEGKRLDIPSCSPDGGTIGNAVGSLCRHLADVFLIAADGFGQFLAEALQLLVLHLAPLLHATGNEPCRLVDVLKNGAMAGAFFEAFVISEIMKSYYNKGVLDLPLYFYRDSHKKEIDLLIEESGVLYPLEIKKHADPRKDDIRVFGMLDDVVGYKRGPGGVICMYDSIVSLDEKDKVIPVQYL